MAQTPKFSETLWHAFEPTYDRVTNGRHDFKNFKTMLEERVKVEEAYAKSLDNIVKNTPNMEAKGTMEVFWGVMKETMTNLADQHRQMAQVFKGQIVKALDGSIKNLKKKKTEIQKAYMKLKSDKDKKTALHAKARQRYEDAVKHAETAVINKDNGLKEQFVEQKQKKLEREVKTSLKEVEKSERAYRESVQALQESQQLYDEKMAEHLDAFEQLEREREMIAQMQYSTYTQSHEFLKGSVEQIVQNLTKAMNEVNINTDVAQFIQENESKDPIPEHVQYVAIASPIIEHATGGAQGAAAPPSAQPAATKAAPPQKKAETKKAVAPAAPLGRKPSTKQQSPPTATVTALYDYMSDQPGDLSFHAGDKISVLEKRGDWWQGECNGQSGIFPANYVEEVADQAGGGDGDTADKPTVMEAKCEALYDFEAQGADELSFKQGDVLHVTGELNGWYLGKTEDGLKVGIFPANYVEITSS